MRIVTWNTCLTKGRLAPKLAAARGLHADVLILQEVAASDACGVWTDVNGGYGISLLAGAGFDASGGVTDETGCAVRVGIAGPHDFDVLAVWAHTRPTYGKVMSSIARSFAEWRKFSDHVPMIVDVTPHAADASKGFTTETRRHRGVSVYLRVSVPLW
ncbi:MAG: hypothetical protein ABIO78_09995 [Thermoanaerobaculia bacterium]